MPPRSALTRAGLLAALVLGWWWLRSRHPAWIAAVAGWVSSRPWLSERATAIVGAVLLTIYFLLLMWGRYSPWRRRSPDGAMGEGCVVMAAYAVAAIGLVLALAWYFHITAIVRLIGVVTTLLTIHLLASLAYEFFKWLRKKWQNRQRRIGQLSDLLAGRTHVIERISAPATDSAPPRRWREYRYYAPDGRMLVYTQGRDTDTAADLRPHPVHVTWSTEPGGQLVTHSSIDGGKTFRFTLTLGPGGQFSYHHHDPGSEVHGRILFRTSEILEGDPAPQSTPSPVPQP